MHVGAGTGYYSAIMTNFVAATGKVTAIEFEPELAARRKQILLPIGAFPWFRGMKLRGFRCSRCDLCKRRSNSTVPYLGDFTQLRREFAPHEKLLFW